MSIPSDAEAPVVGAGLAGPAGLIAPPRLRLRHPVDLGGGLYVAGDHLDTPSIQGALVSGRRAATAVPRARRTEVVA